MKSKFKRAALVMIAAALLATSTVSCSGGSSRSSATSENTSSQTKGKAETQAEKETQAETEPETEVQTTAAGIGEYIQGENFKITLADAKLYDEIQSPDSEYLTDTPDDGNQYLVLFLEAENISDEEQNINMFYYDAYLDDTSVDTELLFTEPEGYSMFSDDVAAGKKLKGYVAYQVPKGDWSTLEFTYEDGILSDSEKYEFIVNSNDIK